MVTSNGTINVYKRVYEKYNHLTGSDENVHSLQSVTILKIQNIDLDCSYILAKVFNNFFTLVTTTNPVNILKIIYIKYTLTNLNFLKILKDENVNTVVEHIVDGIWNGIEI